MTSKQVLLVEDEANIRETLRFNLLREGYKVVEAATGGEALRLARSEHPDIVLLDLMLPEMSGLEVCRLLRQDQSSTPIIMLTAKDQEADKVLGLALGADDYITKPFSLQELFARITAVLRRSGTNGNRRNGSSETEVLGDLSVDHAARRALIDGVELKLSRKEFDLLAFLLSHPGRVFSREQLIRQVWDYNFVGDRKTVDVHIRWLRQKLGDNLPMTVATVRGVGYRLDRLDA